MPIVPDTKNWTWVLDRECPECGFDASATDARRVAALLRENAASWPAVLAAPDATVRPDDSTWSALEYAAHVRDVNRIFRTRLELMLSEDDPIYPNWDQDAAAREGRYSEQDPAVVADELTASATIMADAIDAIPDADWTRRGRRTDGAEFTVDTLMRYFLHDVVHHRWDVSGVTAGR